MRVLLDTHAFLWWIQDSDRLSRVAREVIADRTNSVLVSLASFWEISIKISLGRLSLTDNSLTFIQRQIHENEFHFFPITLDHAWGLQDLPPLHNDPFDRMLIIQAQQEGIPLLTCDDAIRQYAIETRW